VRGCFGSITAKPETTRFWGYFRVGDHGTGTEILLENCCEQQVLNSHDFPVDVKSTAVSNFRHTRANKSAPKTWRRFAESENRSFQLHASTLAQQ
jgi:hypothetical protein